MPMAKSNTSAEKMALDGSNESQDSEQVLIAYQQIYGVGLMSSSPPEGEEVPRVPFLPKSYHRTPRQSQESEDRKKSRQSWGTHPAQPSVSFVSLPPETRNAIIDNRDFVRSLPTDIYSLAGRSDAELELKAERPSKPSEKAAFASSAAGQAEPCVSGVPTPLVPDALNQTVPGAAADRKMDSSQSPTQSNDGRSYEKYFRGSQRSDKHDEVALLEDAVPAIETFTQSSIHEQKSLSEDDTGAVVFAFDNAVATHATHSLPSDQSPQPPLASVRARTFALQQHTSQTQEQLPETPAVRNNPFAGANQFPLLPTSQLFKATQFSSALRRGGSPTSSRPSPNDFPHNTISPNPVSSPLKDRGLRTSPTAGRLSSPEPIHATDSPGPENEPVTPFHTESVDPDDPVVPESPQYRGVKTKPIPAPMDVYVPMRQSQERRSSSIVQQDAASPELSDDGDDPIDRRRRARSKKEASLKRLTSIKVTRTPKSEDVEVPSTNTKKRNGRTVAQQYIDQCYGSQEEPGQDSESQDRVENSQDASALLRVSRPDQHEEATQSSHSDETVPLEGTIARSSTTDGDPHPKRRRGPGPLLRLDSIQTNVANGETIPETSPIDKGPGPSAPGFTSSAPLKPSSNRVVVGSSKDINDGTEGPKSSVTEYVPPATASGTTLSGSGPDLPPIETLSHVQGVIEEHRVSSPKLPELSRHTTAALASSPPAPAFSTRSKTRQQQHEHVTSEPPAVRSSKELLDPLTSMSTLSTLSATPSLTSNETTPMSQISRARPGSRANQTETPNSSPAGAKNKRRRVGDLPRLDIHSTADNLRISRRLTGQQPLDSTDELAKSPTVTPTFERSVRGPPRNSISRPTRTGTADLQVRQDQSYRRPGRLFDGMAFAVSFRGRQPGEGEAAYAEREKSAERLGAMIVQAGGKVLENGFIDLFRSENSRSATASPASSAPSSSPLGGEGDVTLTPAARRLGFTALITDGHSRKAKYMQALALGLPCLASKWITACLDSGEIVDWAPYLLCAGESTFLGGAYKSRVITPYDATEARLAQVIEVRPRLLDGNNVLLVMKKSEENKGMAYVFLARVLGASISRVSSVNEAKAKIKASQDIGQSFDWVYAEAGTSSMNAGGNSKKRKRGGGQSSSMVWTLDNIRTLTDELVIQSLILGRLLQEGEM